MSNPIAANRAQLRRQLRAARRALSTAQQQRAARNLYKQLAQHPIFRRARHIALYLPNDGEIDPGWLLRAAQRRGKVTYLPVLSAWPKTKMVFQRIRPHDKLGLNRFKIAEPRANRALQRKVWSLDLVLMPLVGFDPHGGRLGMGGGFYDKTLASAAHKPFRLGIAHDFQLLDIPLHRETWDQPLDALATPSKYLSFIR